MGLGLEKNGFLLSLGNEVQREFPCMRLALLIIGLDIMSTHDEGVCYQIFNQIRIIFLPGKLSYKKSIRTPVTSQHKFHLFILNTRQFLDKNHE